MFGMDKKARRKLRRKVFIKEKSEFFASMLAGAVGIFVLLYMWMEANVERTPEKEEEELKFYMDDEEEDEE